MNVLVVLAHPNQESFNHPMLLTCEIAEGAELTVQVAVHCHGLVSADGIIIIHPNWWGQPLAILKGWVDRHFKKDASLQQG